MEINKTVIIDLRSWSWTGIGRVTRGVYECTQEIKKDFNFYYIVNNDVPKYNEIPNSIHFKSKPFGPFEQFEFIKLFYLFKSHKNVIIHSLYFNVPIFIPKNFKTVCNFYDVLSGTDEFKSIFHRLAYNIYIYSLKRNKSQILAQSDFTCEQILEHHPLHNIIVCPPGFKNYLNSDIVNTSEIYGINNNYFLYVGLNKPRKNLFGLLSSYLENLKNNPDIKYDLVICGPIFDYTRFGFDIEKFVSRHSELHGRVHLLGFVPDNHLSSLYRNATLYIVPSHLESGFSYPALESLSYGTPVLLNKVDMSNFSSEDESTFFFDGESIEGKGSLKDVLSIMLTKINFKKIDPLYCDVLLRFSWAKVTSTLKQVYSNI